MGKKKQTQLPMCTYGAGCTRPGCIYRHPPKGVVPKSEAICMPFVAGFCEFGERCRNVHLCESDAEALRRKYARTMCEWGVQCRNKLCLYSHPQLDDELAACGIASMGLHPRTDEPASVHHGGQPMPLLPGGVWQEDLHDAGQLTWEEHQQQRIVAPAAASGSRTDRPHDAPGTGGGSSLGAQTVSFTAGGGSAGDAPQCAECGRASDGCVDATDGCFYCDACWDAFDGEAPADTAGAMPAESCAAEPPTGTFQAPPPHPMHPAACGNANAAALSGHQPGALFPATHPASDARHAPGMSECVPAPVAYAPSGAWASVAGRSAAGGGGSAGCSASVGRTGGASGAMGGTGGGGGHADGILRSKEVVLPQQVWLPEVGRTAAAAFNIADPLSRFHAVNAPHRARGELLPLLFSQEQARGAATAGGGVVLDLHFQSAKTAPQVRPASQTARNKKTHTLSTLTAHIPSALAHRCWMPSCPRC